MSYPRFALLSDKTPYRSARTGPAVDRYADHLLPGGTAKIDRRRSIEGEKGKKKKKREEDDTYLLSPRYSHPRVILLRCEETERLPARGERLRRCILMLDGTLWQVFSMLPGVLADIVKYLWLLFDLSVGPDNIVENGPYK
ncbi:hypothetical protein GW17_00000361 [Ensete ventricosum]|nr:hypothetical protein GW17_00000361 [Ensete ventricosum]